MIDLVVVVVVVGGGVAVVVFIVAVIVVVVVVVAVFVAFVVFDKVKCMEPANAGYCFDARFYHRC